MSRSLLMLVGVLFVLIRCGCWHSLILILVLVLIPPITFNLNQTTIVFIVVKMLWHSNLFWMWNVYHVLGYNQRLIDNFIIYSGVYLTSIKTLLPQGGTTLPEFRSLWVENGGRVLEKESLLWFRMNNVWVDSAVWRNRWWIDVRTSHAG